MLPRVRREGNDDERHGAASVPRKAILGWTSPFPREPRRISSGRRGPPGTALLTNPDHLTEGNIPVLRVLDEALTDPNCGILTPLLRAMYSCSFFTAAP